MDRVAVRWEQRFGDEALRQFEQDKRELLALLHKGKRRALEQKATVDWRMVGQDWEFYLKQAGDRWREAFIPLIQGVIVDQANQWALDFGMEFDVRNLFAEAWFSDYTLRFAQPIMETTSTAMSQMLHDAMEEGWSISRMQNHLETIFQQWMYGDLTAEAFTWFAERMPAFRREMIARTETIRASNQGANRLFGAWGVEGKEWLTAIDDRTCPWCADLNGRVIGVHEIFFEKGQTFTVGEGEDGRMLHLDFEEITAPPLHPNCRCTLLPWREAWVQ